MKAECQICGRKLSTRGGLLYPHNYEIPTSTGYITGYCKGARKLSYDKSCDAIVEYIDYLQARLSEAHKELAVYRRGNASIPGLDLRKSIIKPGHKGYDEARQLIIRKTENHIKRMDNELSKMRERLSTWEKGNNHG